MTECPQCGQKLTGSESACPACGMRLKPATSLVRGYFSDVWEILTRPSKFFQRMPRSGGLSSPLAFALVTHWIGKAASFLWHSALGGDASRFINRLMKMAQWDIDHPGRFGESQSVWLWDMQSRVGTWLFGMGSVVIDPFVTLFSILFTAVFVFAGARLLVTPGREGVSAAPPREITYETAVRLVCYGMTPSILAGLPLFGWGLASILTVVVTVIGAKEIYKTGTGRAVAIALFPKILLVSFFLLGFLMFALLLAKFITSLF